ncbi:MAG: magnesium transporter CorA family protein [Chloroflexi bacterium]|nr:magnesium transporter CorA family protein [Chloroflexota bacterium]
MLIVRARRSDGTVELNLSLEAGLALVADPKALVWFDIDEQSLPEIDTVSAGLSLNHLTVEDLKHRGQRGKLEQFDGYSVLVMHSVGYDPVVPRLEEHELDAVIGPNWILTGRDPHLVALLPGEDLEVRLPSMIASDAGYLLYAIADRVVDSLFPVLDQMLDDVDDIEDRVILHPDNALLERIFAMKRNGVTLRKLISPHLEIFTRFTSPAYGIVSSEHMIYFRDVHDHLIRLFEIVDSYRELMTGALEVHLATVNNQLSDVMKRLTVLTAMFLPLTFITGAFGMNMVQSPVWTDPAFWIIGSGMVAISVGQCVYFRNRGWA